MKLSELKNNQTAVIVKVRGYGSFRKRIIEMGFVRGQKVTVIKNAPLKDPIEYKVMDYLISLRRSEASLIEVISIEESKKLKKIAYDGVIEESRLRDIALEKRKTISIAFVGNPNSGKTTLFNEATGSHEHVGNFSGVTIDAKKGRYKFKGYVFKIVDLPGTYSLTTFSPEEIYVRNHILDKAPDIVVNVVDASNLERNLYLTTQLIDMDLRMVVALNMYDELEAKGINFDYEKLAKMLGSPFVPTVASKGKGLDQLFTEIIDVYEDNEPITRHIHINYGETTELAIKKIREEIILNKELTYKISPRFMAVKLLEEDAHVTKMASEYPEGAKILATAKRECKRLQDILQTDSGTIITEAKYGFIAGALKETLHKIGNKESVDTSKLIDTFVTHRLWGFPIFFLFLYTMFKTTFSLGQYPQVWLGNGIDLIRSGVSSLLTTGPLSDLLLDGIIGGVGDVLVFLPNILILYFFISFMEDSGYMARTAFIMDRLMHKLGLHGKSFIPLIMGFGCNVPAIMSTRTIENKNNRILTTLLIPLMSCSARLPVYILLIGSFFSEYAALVLFTVYLSGIFLAVIVARVFKRFFFKKEEAPFVMELPPYRMPSMKTTLIHMWKKGEQYLRKIGGIILLASILIWFLGYYPKNTQLTKELTSQINTIENSYAQSIKEAEGQTELMQTLFINKKQALSPLVHKRKMIVQSNSYLGKLGKGIEPIIAPLGFNWKIGVSLLCGIPAKEIIISSLAVLYFDDADGNNLSKQIAMPVYNGEHSSNGLDSVSAFALLIFVLLYFPCFATLIAIKNETGNWKWSALTLFYTTGLAWILAFLINTIGRLFI